MPKPDKHSTPSIHSYPFLPPVSSHFDPQSSHLAERDNLRQLAALTERGGAAVFLEHVLKDSLRDRRRQHLDGAKSDSDSDERELRDKGFVHRRKRTRSVTFDGATTGLEGDDEAGSESDDGEEGRIATAREKRARARRRSKRRREEVKLPEVEVDEVPVPPDFPADTLFSAIHTHTSTLFSSRHNLLPPLTPAQPFLSPELKAHFDAEEARINDEEEAAAKAGEQAKFMAYKRTRVGKAGGGGRYAAWTDAGKAFEGTALVALGLLSKLLVEDAARPATPARHSPTASSAPAAPDTAQPAADANA
ncbi:hypothetical protein JCM10207_004653 [Rhodosporidiobolus poonsookiae]